MKLVMTRKEWDEAVVAYRAEPEDALHVGEDTDGRYAYVLYRHWDQRIPVEIVG